MSKYLLEIGTEELPYRFIPSAVNQLKKLFEDFLNENKVGFSDVKVYATPRRLAVIVDGLESKSPDEVKVVKGPIKKVAYDENGNLCTDYTYDHTHVLGKYYNAWCLWIYDMCCGVKS